MSTSSAALASLIDEIAELVEPFRAKRARRPRYTVVERGGGFDIFRNERNGPVRAASGSFGELSPEKLPRQIASQPVEVRLDAHRVLSKNLQLPVAGRQYLDAIVGHQVERMTPWAADRVVFDYVVDEANSTGEQVAVRLVATSRDVIEAATERLAAIGVKPAIVGTAEDPIDEPSPVNLLEGSKGNRRQALRRTIGVALLGITVAGAALSAWTGWRLYTVNAEAAIVQRELDEARRAVEQARSQSVGSESYARLLDRKRGALPMVALIEELSKRIPAGTYLSELQAEGQELRMAGFSDGAPALIGTLEAAEALTDVRFAAPTTRDDATNQDRFEIVARIEPPAGQPTAPEPEAGDDPADREASPDTP
jgi:general secretion pathway protein L